MNSIMKNRDYPLYKRTEYNSLNEMVMHKAEKCSKNTAFQYVQGKKVCEITYSGFLNDVMRMGRFIEENCQSEGHIAILGENSYRWIVAFMAIVMSGRTAVLLDKELDAKSLTKLLVKSDVQYCFCSAGYWDIAGKIQEEDRTVTFFNFKVCEKEIENTDIDNTLLEKWNAQIDVKKLSAIFFTSGTSGDSKGVMLSQENMITDINFACQNVILGGTVLAVLPFHHSFGVMTAVWCSFNYEVPIFINSGLKNVMRDIALAKPQSMFLVPLFVETFSKNIWQKAREKKSDRKLRFGMKISGILLRLGLDIRRKLFREILDGLGGNLECIICGGAPLNTKYVEEFRHFGIEILNGYGITECAPVLAVNRNHYRRDGSVGLVLPGCQVRISAENEIQVRGSNVMLGYYKDSVQTEEAFDKGWFRTGDLGYFDQDGFLYITGRKKNLIILANGENVSPEELEEILLENDLVKEVLVYEEQGMITAEIVPEETQELQDIKQQIKSVIDNCNRALPGYKRIQTWKIRTTEFEKTTTKKIKR